MDYSGPGGHLVPSAAFEQAAVALLENATPMFEVRGDMLILEQPMTGF